MPILWPDLSTNERMTEHQRQNVCLSLRARIGILCGSPGVGKTFCIAEIAAGIIKEFGSDQIAAMCPTGKAAVRITESFTAAGVNIRARTIHSYLAKYSPEHPLPYKFILLDESSMIDTDLAASLMCACSVDAHVLWTGDPNQLPPVGHGAPLRDMIAAGLPYGELTEIMRNSGGIVETCAAIRQGKPWQPADNLEVFEHTGAEFQIKRMLQLIHHFRGEGLDPIWDCQVVVPVNKKSPLARRELNKILQAELNPNAGSDGSPFRVKDKIVNTANGYFPSVEFDESDPETQTNERGEVYVANGELAEVIHVEPKLTVARLANPARTVKIPRCKGTDDRETDDDQKPDDNAPATGCSWDLGYALSVHKSQGSEWPVVLVMLDEYPGAKMVCSREWLYTAISRAKKSCALIGKKTVADAMCRRVALGGRKTFLREQILLQKAGDDLAEL